MAGCVWLGSSAQLAADEQQGLLQAAEEALEQQRPDQVIRLLRGRAHSPPLRMVFAQALAQAVDPEEALRWLEFPEPDADLPQRDAWLQEWPAQLRGPLATQLGDWCAQLQRDDTIWWWTMALDQPGAGVERNRLLLAVAEYAARQERWHLVRSSSETLWQRRASWSYRQAAGELLGRALLHLEPDKGREFLLALLVNPELDDRAHRRVALLLARAVLNHEPSLALMVTEQSLRRNRADPGELPLWHTVALAQLDPQRAARRRGELPAEFANHPALRDLSVATGVQDPIQEALGRAEAAIVLEEWNQAQRHLQPWYRSDSRALRLWAQIPQVALQDVHRSPAFAHPQTAQAVIARLWRDGSWDQAWQAIAHSLEELDLEQDQRLHFLHLALRLARQEERPELPQIIASLREIEREHPAVGEAWVLYARSQQGEAAFAAWLQALRWLPADAPWAPLAARSSLQIALADHPAWSVAENKLPQLEQLAQHRQRLQAIAQAHADDSEAQSTLWLIAQGLYALAEPDQARQVLEQMHRHADAQGQARISRILRQWE